MNAFIRKMMIAAGLLITTIMTVSAQLSFVGQKQMEKQDWDGAYSKILKAMSKNPDDFMNVYSLAILQTTGQPNSGNPYFNPDDAYKHMQRAFELFDALPDKQKEKLNAKWSTAQKEADRYLPADKGYEVAEQTNSVIGWKHFLKTFVVCRPEKQKQAVAWRNSLAYTDAELENTITAYEEFIAAYPDAVQVQDAEVQIEKLFWQQTQEQSTEEAYRTYAAKYPKHPNAKTAIERADAMHYTQFTKAGTLEVFKSYITDFADRTQWIEKAKEAVYKLIKDSTDIAFLQANVAYIPQSQQSAMNQKIEELIAAKAQQEAELAAGENGTTEAAAVAVQAQPVDEGERIKQENAAYDARFVYPKNGELTPFSNSSFSVCRVNGKVGVVDSEKHVRLPIEFDEISDPSKAVSYYRIRQGEYIGMIYCSGEMVIPPVAKSITYNRKTRVYTITEKDGTVQEVDDEMNMLGDSHFIEYGRFLMAKYNTQPYFCIDFSEAKYVMVDKYWTNGIYTEGLMPVWDQASKKLGFLDEKGHWALPYTIPVQAPGSYNSDEEPHLAGGYIMLRNSQDGKYLFYNKSGQLVYSVPTYKNKTNYSISRLTDSGYALMDTKSNDVHKLSYITPKGQTIFPQVYTKSYGFKSGIYGIDVNSYVRPMREGMVAFADFFGDRDIRWGFFNKDGKVVVRPQYNAVHNFSDGLAAVQMTDKSDNALKWGYIDKTGKMVIQARYSNEPFDFHEGLAVVHKTNGTFVYIDKQGNVVSDEYLQAGSFHNGYAFVEIGSEDYRRQFRVINHDFLELAFNISEYIFPDIYASTYYPTYEGDIEYHHNTVRCKAEDRILYTHRGQELQIFSREEYHIKHCNDNIVHVEYGGYPATDIFCDYTGKVIFVLQQNEF